MELGDLWKRRFPGNPKLHALEELGAAFADRGFVEPIILDEKTGQIVAGNGRVEELIALRDSGADAPERIEVRGGKWYVPVVRGVNLKTVDQARKHLLASNRLVERGGYDNKLLVQLLGKIGTTADDLVGTGFDEKDVVRFMALTGSTAKGGKTDPDDVPAPRSRTVSKPGTLWQLGSHRLLCGKSDVAADVARLMGKTQAVMMATDPPYGVDYNSKAEILGSAGFKDWGDMENDDLDPKKLRAFLDAFLTLAMPRLVLRAAIYCWHPSGDLNEVFRAALVAAGVLVHRQIIWRKAHMVLTRSGMYHWIHEPCFYGWRTGKTPPWYGEKNQVSVWDAGRDDGKQVHPTQKPVKLFEIPMLNHTAPGEVCYEPFSGSGSQIIAGERLERRVFAIELSPRWCDVAVERWEQFSGGKAKLVKG